MFLLAFLCFFASAMAQCTEPGTYPDPENPVRCLYCGLAITLPRNCEVCTNASVCLGCKEGYQLSEKPECCYVGAGYYVDNTTQNCLRCPQTIPPNCFSILCEDADSTAECGVCLTGHQLAKTPEGDNTCCSTGTGYFVDPATNICTPCNHITDCLALHCTTATNAECSSCNTTFTKTTPNTCACVAGQYLDAPSHTCKSCSAYCASCSSSLLCNKCDDGFNLANGVCSCPSGKYPVGDLCTTCPIGCSYCVSATECVACSPGYSLPDGDSLGLCTPCPTGCSACAGRVCSTCLSGYIYSQGSCVPPPKCVAGQYLEVSTGSCNACPSGCATCTSPTQCLSCISEYFLPIGSSVCVSGAAFLCNTCDKASTPCSEGHSCCGCDPIGICVPSSQCPTCAALPPCDCSTLDQCALKGSCDSGVDTCKKCVENHQLVSDPSTDLGIACTPKSYQACDLCSGGGIACPSSYTCCCGTCQLGTLPCNRKCPSLYCVKTDGEAEEGVALLEYSVNSDCSHEDEKVTEQVVEGMVWDILGAWGGQTTIVHSCSNNNKRGTTSTLSTSIVLLGPDAQAQALLIIHSIPFNMTANGVVITVVSAEVAESNDLSGGQIAGIVIGSIGCFLLIVIGLYLVLSSNRVDRV